DAGFTDHVEHRRRQRVARALDRGLAGRFLDPRDRDAGCIDDGTRGRGDLGTDPVAGEQRYSVRHSAPRMPADASTRSRLTLVERTRHERPGTGVPRALAERRAARRDAGWLQWGEVRCARGGLLRDYTSASA